MSTTKRIRARIDADAIEKVTRFFRADDEQIVHELVQNARRSGATRVQIECGGEHLTVTDDGCGIADPEIVLCCGKSGWKGDVKREDPAGMGLFALGLRGARIWSRPKDENGKTRTGWRATLTPAVFKGDESCAVKDNDEQPDHHGTQVRIEDPTRRWHPRNVAGTVKRYAVPIEINGKPATPEAFLLSDEATYETRWRGVRIAVYHEPFRRPDRRTEINFHGLVIPELEIEGITTDRDDWWMQIDVEDCRHLKLTLPQRESIVRNEFFAQLKIKAEQSIYRAVEKAGREVRLSHRQWQRARTLGVEIETPHPYGRRWVPLTADAYRFYCDSTETLQGPATVLSRKIRPSNQQVLNRALIRNPQLGKKLNLMTETEELEGFDWYDRLPRVTGLEARITDADSGTSTIEMLKSETRYQHADDRLVDRIEVHLTIRNAQDGTVSEMTLPTDVAFKNSETNTRPEDAGIVLRKNTTGKDRKEIRGVLVDGFLRATEDPDDGSYEAQTEGFQQEAAAALTTLTKGQKAAATDTIRDLVDREIAWRVPEGHGLRIEIDRKGTTEVTLTPATSEDNTPAKTDN